MTSAELPVVLTRIKDGQFQIPQFQREFKWKLPQVKLLVDSIARGYPVGALLVLEENPELVLQSRTIEAEIQAQEELAPGQETERRNRFLVLDGQQRLTSLARVFLDADPTRNYYFDLKEMTTAFANDEPPDDVSYIVYRNRRKNNPERRDKNKLLRADVILTQEKSDIFLTEYIEDSGDFTHLERSEQRKLAASIKGVFEKIRKFQLPFITLQADQKLEAVCRIFETINSTGTRLTTFDLAVARYFPEPDLRRLWSASLERFDILRLFEVDGERVLQLLVIVATDGLPTRKNQLNLPMGAFPIRCAIQA